MYRLNSKESYIPCEFVIILSVEFRCWNSGIYDAAPYLFLKLMNYSAIFPTLHMKIPPLLFVSYMYTKSLLSSHPPPIHL
jgi:hypothetical protein